MKNPSPYLRMRVLGTIDLAPGCSMRQRYKQVAAMSFIDEDGNSRTFTWRTIETWSCRYKKRGITAVHKKIRSDKGTWRKVVPETVLEVIEQVRSLFHGKTYNKSQIYRLCIERGLLRREEIALNTFCRLVNQYELLKPDSEVANKHRLAFSKQFANQMWQADTMFGPFLKINGIGIQSKLICFIDDASRVICHGEFFLQENVETLIKAFRTALYKRGIPEQLYIDHGSVYVSKEITLICARLGCILSHTPVRDGAAKGKIERFFRTVRECFLTRNLDLSSLENLNKQFIAWVEDEYNSKNHSTLGMKPIDRFGMDLSRIRFLPPNQANDELFFVEENRFVKKDNTFSLKNIRFEAPADLRARQIQIRFDRNHPSTAIVYYKSQRIGQATLLNAIANDRHPNPNPNPNPHI